MSGKLNRREFLKNAGAAGAGFWIAGRQSAFAQEKSANAKLNVACIGVAGRGLASVKGCKDENIVALCEIEDGRFKDAAEIAPRAKRYTDYRKMFEDQKELKRIQTNPDDSDFVSQP